MRDALGISRGSKTPFIEEHHTDISNKDKDIIVKPWYKEILLHHAMFLSNLLIQGSMKFIVTKTEIRGITYNIMVRTDHHENMFHQLTFLYVCCKP